VWVDASLSMLFKTIKDTNTKDFPNTTLVALAADFEDPERLKTVYSESFVSLPAFDQPKVFFILGFTLSNLKEEEFFLSYADVCSIDDLFIFPMQFIPEEPPNKNDDLEKFKTNLINAYDFQDGHKLSQSWVDLSENFYDLENIDPKVEEFRFHNSTGSLCVKFKAKIRRKDRTKKTITTAFSNRHQRNNYIDFLKSFGFETLHETNQINGVSMLVVKYVGKNKD
jgi:hypothetical protein